MQYNRSDLNAKTAVDIYVAEVYEYIGTKRIKPHRHKHSYQLYYAIDGGGVFTCNEKSIYLAKGMLLLIQPDMLHERIRCDNIQTVLDIKFNINDPSLISYIASVGILPELSDEARQLLGLLNTLCPFIRGNCLNRITASLLLEALLYLLLPLQGRYSVAETCMSICGVEYSTLSESIQFALKEIESYIVLPVEEFNSTTIARNCGYNQAYLSRIFSEETGTGIASYYQQLRIERAKDFLRNTALDIKTISILLAYKDDSYFNRIFRKKVGLSAKEYRNQFRQ